MTYTRFLSAPARVVDGEKGRPAVPTLNDDVHEHDPHANPSPNALPIILSIIYQAVIVGRVKPLRPQLRSPRRATSASVDYKPFPLVRKRYQGP